MHGIRDPCIAIFSMPIQNPPTPQGQRRPNAAMSSAAAATVLASESNTDYWNQCKSCMIAILTLALVFGVVASLVYLLDSEPDLIFNVESVSVAVGTAGADIMVAAEWDIGFSVKKPHGWSSFDVSVECMSRSWPGEVAELSGGHRQRGDAFATVNTTMPHYIVPGLVHGLKLEFGVVLWANYEWGYRIRGVCNNLTVRLEKGLLVGGPRSCPLDRFFN